MKRKKNDMGPAKRRGRKVDCFGLLEGLTFMARGTPLDARVANHDIALDLIAAMLKGLADKVDAIDRRTGGAKLPKGFGEVK